eukprot:COSAG02_NODE_7685_length_2895_cov_3.989628_5_plen_51_part_01
MHLRLELFNLSPRAAGPAYGTLPPVVRPLVLHCTLEKLDLRRREIQVGFFS